MRPERGVDHPPPNTEVKERVEIYLYWAFVACSMVNFTFTFTTRSCYTYGH